MNTVKSAFFALDKNDFIKGLCVAVLTAILTFLAQSMQLPGFTFSGINWGQLFQFGVMAGAGYLTKNLLTTSNGQVMGMI